MRYKQQCSEKECENTITYLADELRTWPLCSVHRERSKREDSPTEYGAKCKFGLITEREMRCSEHDGNAVREVQ
jgi:hypothetical protein